MIHHLYRALLTLAALAVLTLTPAHAEAVEVHDLPVYTYLPPCEYEDSSNCFWDAGSSGNGVGHSFYDIGGILFYTGQVF
jgi:hypothetical protein